MRKITELVFTAFFWSAWILSLVAFFREVGADRLSLGILWQGGLLAVLLFGAIRWTAKRSGTAFEQTQGRPRVESRMGWEEEDLRRARSLRWIDLQFVDQGWKCRIGDGLPVS